MDTVAGNEALVLNSSKQFPDIDVFGLNPGFVRTGIRSNVFGFKLLLKIAEGLTSYHDDRAGSLCGTDGIIAGFPGCRGPKRRDVQL
jgi:hypothetical protein